MVFEPSKSELIHFTKAHHTPTREVYLGLTPVKPVDSARFLGVWIDRKLSWKAYLRKTKEKFATQSFALTRLAGSTWGCSLIRAREIYTKVIRSALAYGASSFHIPGTAQAPQGIARLLIPLQTRCLRIVAGAYKATAVRHLETETFVPPLDLYLSKRLADFEARLQASGAADRISRACLAVQSYLRRRRPLPGRGRPARLLPALSAVQLGTGSNRNSASWAIQWSRGPLPDFQSYTSSQRPLRPLFTSAEALARDWETRWHYELAARLHRRPDRLPEAADHIPSSFSRGHSLRLYKGLRKAESSALVQIRAGKIGLRAFLYQRKVPGIDDPYCLACRDEFGTAPLEDAYHVITECPVLHEARKALSEALCIPIGSWDHARFHTALRDPRQAILITRWIITSGRLPEYGLATEFEAREREDEWAAGATA